MLRLKGMGISLQSNDTVSNPERLQTKLAKLQELGYKAVELPIQGMNVIMNGILDERRLDVYVKLLRDFPFIYTTHAPFDLNLFRPTDPSTEERLLTASLEVSGAIGAATMVYHVGRYIGEEEFTHPQAWNHYSENEKQQLLKYEAACLRKAGERAKQLNIRIGMENMRPYLDCPDYCYSVNPTALAEQIKEVGHPNVGVTLDVGHLYLACGMYQLDPVEQIKAILQYICHLHVHDNFGKPCFSTEKNQYELTALGRGDMHMPIGDGQVPMREIVELLTPVFEGVLIHEVRDIYEWAWPVLGERMNAIIQAAENGGRNKAGIA